jgi:hypothetical protein
MKSDEITYGNTITLQNGNTLSIPHIHLELLDDGWVTLQTESGWVYYRLDTYPEGTPADDICYYRFGAFSANYDFTNIVVVNETTINSDQIYGTGNEPVTE